MANPEYCVCFSSTLFLESTRTDEDKSTCWLHLSHVTIAFTHLCFFLHAAVKPSCFQPENAKRFEITNEETSELNCFQLIGGDLYLHQIRDQRPSCPRPAFQSIPSLPFKTHMTLTHGASRTSVLTVLRCYPTPGPGPEQLNWIFSDGSSRTHEELQATKAIRLVIVPSQDKIHRSHFCNLLNKYLNNRTSRNCFSVWRHGQ